MEKMIDLTLVSHRLPCFVGTKRHQTKLQVRLTSREKIPTNHNNERSTTKDNTFVALTYLLSQELRTVAAPGGAL